MSSLIRRNAVAEIMFQWNSMHPDDRKYKQILFRKDASRTCLHLPALARSLSHATHEFNHLVIDGGVRYLSAVPQ